MYTDPDLTASTAIEELFTKYIDFSLDAVLPHAVDGFTKVQRRVVQIFGQNEGVKDVSAWAAAVKVLHPHGESSIENVLTRMMQPFKFQIPLIKTHGHSGSYKDAKAADQRYLKASATQFMKDLYFNTHKAALTYKASESSEVGLELEYYIPKIPMSLCMPAEGIGVGYSTECFPLDITNVCDLATWYIDEVAAGRDTEVVGNRFPKEIGHLLLPTFPIECIIRNKEQLIDNICKGKVDNRVEVEGNYRLTQNEMTLHTIPYGTDFVTKSKQFDTIRKSRDKNFIQLLDELDEVQNITDGKLRMRYKIIFKKRASSWKHLKTISSLFGLSLAMSPTSRWLMKSGTHGILGIGQLLDIWYRERYRAVKIKFNKDKDEYTLQLHKLKGILVLKDHDEEIIKIIRECDTSQEYIQALKVRFELTAYQASEIGKIPLDRIRKTSRENIVKDIEYVEQKIKEIDQDILDIPLFMKREIRILKDKHCTNLDKRTIYPTYKGFVITPEGYVQVQTIEEAKNRCHFDNFQILILPYSACKYKYKKNALGKWDSDHPVLFRRYIEQCELTYLPVPATSTVVVNDTDGLNIFRCNGTQSVINSQNLKSVAFCGDMVTTINKKGMVNIIDTNTLPLRRTMDAQGNKTDIIYVSGQAYQDMLIFCCNSSEPNVIRVSRIVNGKGKLNAYLGEGTVTYLIVPNTTEELIFLPMAEIFNRMKPCHIYVPNLSNLLGDKHSMIMDLTKNPKNKIYSHLTVTSSGLGIKTN